jgi:hypothetical protein
VKGLERSARQNLLIEYEKRSNRESQHIDYGGLVSSKTSADNEQSYNCKRQQTDDFGQTKKVRGVGRSQEMNVGGSRAKSRHQVQIRREGRQHQNNHEREPRQRLFAILTKDEPDSRKAKRPDEREGPVIDVGKNQHCEKTSRTQGVKNNRAFARGCRRATYQRAVAE